MTRPPGVCRACSCEPKGHPTGMSSYLWPWLCDCHTYLKNSLSADRKISWSLPHSCVTWQPLLNKSWKLNNRLTDSQSILEHVLLKQTPQCNPVSAGEVVYVYTFTSSQHLCLISLSGVLHVTRKVVVTWLTDSAGAHSSRVTVNILHLVSFSLCPLGSIYSSNCQVKDDLPCCWPTPAYPPSSEMIELQMTKAICVRERAEIFFFFFF